MLSNNIQVDGSFSGVFISTQKKFIFFGINKCASTTFKTMFHKVVEGKMTWDPRKVKLNNYSNFYKWCIIREPMDRFKSLYKQLRNVKSEAAQGRVKTKWGIDSMEELTIKKFAQHLTLTEVGSLTQHDQLPALKEMNYIATLDDIKNDWDFLIKKIGLRNIKLLRKNIKNSKNFDLKMDEEDINNVKRFFTKDFEWYKKVKDGKTL